MKPNTSLRMVVGIVAIMALALAAVGPVLAQVGGPEQPGTPAFGIRVPVEEGDNLGSLADLYQLNDDNFARFFSANLGLRLNPGQTVTFPEGVAVNIDGTAAEGSTYQTRAGDTLGDLLGWMGFEPIPLEEMGISSGSPDPAFDSGAGGAVRDPGTAGSGDTSGDADANAAGETDVFGMQAAPTVEAGSGEAVSPTAVPAQDGETAAGETVEDGVGLDEQHLVEFAELNRDLTFEQDQMLRLLPGIPRTGQELQSTPTVGAAATNQVREGLTAGRIPTPSAGGDDASVIAKQQAGMGGADVADEEGDSAGDSAAGEDNAVGPVVADRIPTPGGPADLNASERLMGIPQTGSQDASGSYSVQQGDTLQSIADRYGITLEQLISLNPNLIQPDDVLVVPEHEAGDD